MFALSHNKLSFQTVKSNTVSNPLKACNINKAIGIENISGKFLKDGANVLAIKLYHFLKDCKLKKLKPLYRYYETDHTSNNI